MNARLTQPTQSTQYPLTLYKTTPICRSIGGLGSVRAQRAGQWATAQNSLAFFEVFPCERALRFLLGRRCRVEHGYIKNRLHPIKLG